MNTQNERASDGREKTDGSGALAVASGSTTISVHGSPLFPGSAKRFARLLKARGMAAKHARCPECGDKVIASDSRGIATPPYRYSIACESDCVGVYAPTVKAAVEMWKDSFSSNTKVTNSGAEKS